MCCMHAWAQMCIKLLSCTECILIKTILWLQSQTIAVSSVRFLPIVVESNRIWTSAIIQPAACTVGEKKKKKQALGSTEKSSEAQLAIALREEGLDLFISETTHAKKPKKKNLHFDVPERQQDYFTWNYQLNKHAKTTHNCLIYCMCWIFLKKPSCCTDSPYLLMDVRDMLADVGMLYDDVCLGTKATTQRSDTCEDTHRRRFMLMLAGVQNLHDCYFQKTTKHGRLSALDSSKAA